MLDYIFNYWGFILLFVFIILSFVVNLFDRFIKKRVGFVYTEMPHMQPIPILTKDMGFWKGMYLWMFGSRKWKLTKDFNFALNNEFYVIPKGFYFNGVSIPKIFSNWLSPVGILLMGSLVHDFAYKYGVLVKIGNKQEQISRKQADQYFRDICIEINGFLFLNYLAYAILRMFGIFSWNHHRKNNKKVQ